MSLDELTLDGDETGGASREAPSEKSEKQKEVSRQAQAQLQKTQKDEKKAKGDNDDLFLLLTRFIKNPLYEELIPSVTRLLQYAYPSRFILSLIALVFPEAAQYLFMKIGKEVSSSHYRGIYHYTEARTFHNDDIHPSLRDWVTLWMTSLQKFLTDESSSVILSKKLALLLSGEDREVAIKSIAEVFRYFFVTKNVIIDEETSLTYADFILAQIEQTVKHSLDSSDPDLKNSENIDANTLFGI